MAWEENSCICLNMQLIAILSRIGVTLETKNVFKNCNTVTVTQKIRFWKLSTVKL